MGRNVRDRLIATLPEALGSYSLSVMKLWCPVPEMEAKK